MSIDVRAMLKSSFFFAVALIVASCAGERGSSPGTPSQPQTAPPAGQAMPPGGMMMPPTAGAGGAAPPVNTGVPARSGAAGAAGSGTPGASTAGAAAIGAAGATASAAGAGAAGSGAPGQPMMDGPLNMAPAKFGPNIKVNDNMGSGQESEVTMAVRNGTIFVGWMDNRSRPRPCGYSWSTDGGTTWSKNLTVTTKATGGSAFAGDPAVAIDEKGNLYAVCQDYASGGLGTNYVLMGHSKDGGATWSEFERVNQSLDKPWVGATGDGTVLLTWLGNPGGMKRSTDYGATWDDTISLGYINHGTSVSWANNGLVHVPYNTDETTVTYRRSKDNGVTFEPARDLTQQGQPCRSPCSPRSHPIIGGGADPTGKVVAITWASRLQHPDAEGDDDVWVIVSYDSGDTFSEPIRVNDNTSESRQFQSWVAVDKYGAVHVVWTDLRNGGENSTYYARMTSMDSGFEANVEVTDDRGPANSFIGDYKGIDIDGRDVVVVWTDTRNDSGDIYFARAKDAAAAGGPLMP